MLLAFLFPQSLQADLGKILDAQQLQGAIVAAMVSRLDGTVLYQRNADMRVMPASNQKLLSCSYALHTLGEGFVPKTLVWKLEDRILIKSEGDPMLSHAQLVGARRLMALEKTLPVYVDQAYAPGIPPTWEWDDLPNKYAAPVTALTVDRGSFELWAENGKLLFVPEAYGTRTMHFDSGSRVRVEYMPGKRFAVVRGPLPAARTRLDTLALPEPDRAAAGLLGSPIIRLPFAPPSGQPYVIGGRPLPDILKACLTTSDNNIAEHLLLMAAGQQGALSEAPYRIATQRMKDFLTGVVGLEAQEVSPYDGSGMSRHNNVTAAAISKVLRWASKKWGTAWTDLLATPGVGTLSSRLSGSTFRGKTGSLDLASALSGYVNGPDGQTLVVSLIFNHYTGSAGDIRGIQDRFIQRLEAGTGIAWTIHHESHSPDAKHRPLDRHRSHRHDHDGLASRSGQDRGDESAHARLSGAERVAIRPR